MATTSIADYQVLADASFTLDADGTDKKTLSFSIPSDLNTSTALSRRAVLSFMISPLELSRLKIRFHGAEIVNTLFNKSHTRSYMEAFTLRSALHIGEDLGGGTIGVNDFDDPVDVDFTVISGRARLSDIVVWHQINRGG